MPETMFAAIRNEILHDYPASALEQEEHFRLRQKARETIAILKAMRQTSPEYAELLLHADALEKRIEQIHAALRAKYTKFLLKPGVSPLEIRDLFNRFTDYQPGSFGYLHYADDNLDAFLDNLFELNVDAIRVPTHRTGMIHLERTPASIILELIDQLTLTDQDVLIDLGSGLGHVLYLFRFLTPVTCIGIEIERMYHEAALRVAKAFRFNKLTLINNDVRECDFDQGTILFMFSPFSDHVLETVLQKLKRLGQQNPICLCSYGNITTRLHQENWLKIREPEMAHPYKAAIFSVNVRTCDTSLRYL